MKFYKRLLLTLPFIITSLVYYKFYNPDEDCEGLVNSMSGLIIFFFLAFTGMLGFLASVGRDRHQKFRLIPITFSILILSLLFVIYNATLRGHTKGDKWIYADSKNINSEAEDVTLRKNGTFTVNLIAIDFACAISGTYTRSGDTIFFDEKAINKTDSKMTTIYLVSSSELIPLFDTTDKRTFDIREVR